LVTLEQNPQVRKQNIKKCYSPPILPQVNNFFSITDKIAERRCPLPLTEHQDISKKSAKMCFTACFLNKVFKFRFGNEEAFRRVSRFVEAGQN